MSALKILQDGIFITLMLLHQFSVDLKFISVVFEYNFSTLGLFFGCARAFWVKVLNTVLWFADGGRFLL